MCLMFDIVAPKDQPHYVPEKRRKRRIVLYTVLFKALEQGATIIMERINNMKIKRSSRPLKLRYSGCRPKRKKGKHILRAPLTGMTTTWSSDQIAPTRTFDSNVQTLMVDDGASACIMNNANDFIQPPKRVDKMVKGIKCHDQAIHRRTLKWYIEDDNVLVHVMVITGAYLIPETATRILSPQHLAQQVNDNYPTAEGTGALTTSKNITLFWAQRCFTKTVPLDSKTSVGLTTTASSTQSFRAFCATVNNQETKELNIFTTHVIPDEEDNESFQPKGPVEPAPKMKSNKSKPWTK